MFLSYALLMGAVFIFSTVLFTTGFNYTFFVVGIAMTGGGIICAIICHTNEKYIGGKYEYNERYVLKPSADITAYEVAQILSDFVDGGFDPGFLSKLPDEFRLTRHFKKMSFKEFDAVYNPDMEIDE